MCLMNGARYDYEFNEVFNVEDYIKAEGFDILSYLDLRKSELCDYIYIFLDRPYQCLDNDLSKRDNDRDYSKHIR